TITARKAWKVARRESRIREVGESALRAPRDDSHGPRGWEQILGREPTPELACQVAEGCLRLLDRLSPELQSVAPWKMKASPTPRLPSAWAASPVPSNASCG